MLESQIQELLEYGHQKIHKIPLVLLAIWVKYPSSYSFISTRSYVQIKSLLCRRLFRSRSHRIRIYAWTSIKLLFYFCRDLIMESQEKKYVTQFSLSKFKLRSTKFLRAGLLKLQTLLIRYFLQLLSLLVSIKKACKQTGSEWPK